MSERLPPDAEPSRPGVRKVLKVILGLAALELAFFLFRLGAGWFNGQTMPWN